MDLYTLGTPNGHKISIALEELGLSYNVIKIDITKGDQFKPEFVKINPNSKIPALVDGDIVLFESVAILIYLAEKYGRLIPQDEKKRYETLCWSLFQAANIGPMMGQLGHFKVYAKDKIPYAIERYSKEVTRLLGVMNSRLEKSRYLACDEYTIADIATWPWLAGFMRHYKEPIDEQAFPHVMRWFREIEQRPAVQKGITIPS